MSEQPVVEVDIFSGRPNPTWTLTSAEVDELVGVIHALPVEENSTATEGGQLGFRGFTVVDLEVEGLGDHDHLTVLPERVLVMGSDGLQESLDDVEGTVHDALRQMAEEHLSQEIVDAIP